MRVFYNGVDVTDNENMRRAIANAPSHWYGSQSAYNELVDNNQLVAGVAYHVEVQADWSETDQKHLGYVKNQPKVMDMDVENHNAKFFYTRYNQVVPYTNSSASQGQQGE